MKKLAIGLGCVLALAACGISDADIGNLENSIRETAAQQGMTVKEVNLRKELNDRVVGDAIVHPRDNPNMEIRWDCSAERQDGTRLQWRCAPAGQTAGNTATPAATPAPTPAPSPAPAPPPAAGGTERLAYVGRWTETNDCNNVTLLGGDGIFITSDGGRGNWDVRGGQLGLSGPGGQATLQVFLNNPNTMTLTGSDGTQSIWTRC